MRTVLGSLRENEHLQERTGKRLATGRRVNQALDNPTNFFAAKQAQSHADSLQQVLTGIDNGLNVIKAANAGITAISELVKQMKGVVSAARQTSDRNDRTAYAGIFDELLSQINKTVQDSSYGNLNLIGDTDPRRLVAKADDLTVNFTPEGASSLTVEGKFLGSGYALYEAGETTAAWVPDATGTVIQKMDDSSKVVTAPQYDFIFVVDDTASMGASINQIKTNIDTFIDKVAGLGIDARFGLERYGEEAEAPAQFLGFFADGASFKAALATLAPHGGGDTPESGLDALQLAAGQAFRPAAAKEFVLITDANFHEKTLDNRSPLTFADVAATLQANNISLTIAGNPAYKPEIQPLLDGVGASFYNYTDPNFYTGDFGLTISTLPTIVTKEATVTGADYDRGVFSLQSSGPPPVAITVTADRQGLGIYHSWLYQGLQTNDGIDQASRDLDSAIGRIRSQANRFGADSSVFSTRQDFSRESVAVNLEGADTLTLADMNEEAATALMLQVRENLGISTLQLAAKDSQQVLKLF